MPELKVSARAEAVTRRTYNRPLDPEGMKFETWEETVHRSHYEHHFRLWKEAGGEPDLEELSELKQLGLSRAGMVAGRTLWLGGTDYAFSRPASQFNCAATGLSTVYDMVDAFWGLLNGCGMGGFPQSGTLHGYSRRIPKLVTIPSENSKDYRGPKDNTEEKPSASNNWRWTIRIGDSAEAWAKALGKMLISPRTRCDELVIDYSQVRGKGGRLRGYGWICNGYEPLEEAQKAIHEILNEAAGNLLDEEQIGDIFNWCGTVLSSRRAAESMMLPHNHPRAAEFARRKKDHWKSPRTKQRRQSNNSLMFWERPSVDDLADLLYLNLVGGEPGFVNAYAAIMKCPWFQLFNPCFEIMLARYGFCNLASLALPLFGRDFARLERAVRILARANYRQTCVDLNDGVLQPQWHQTNEALRLCGLSFTGIVQSPWLTDYDIRRLRNAAVNGAYSMAMELGMPLPKAVTTGKPEGTRSKITGTDDMEIAEGMHLPLGEHILNWINFAAVDPMVGAMERAGYKVIPNPSDSANVLVRFPVHYSNCPFQTVNGIRVNMEPAVDQLRRYRRWNTHWADHNISATISLSREEVPEVAQWIHRNWNKGYIATAFTQRLDPMLTPEQVGHPYLPQEVVSKEDWEKAKAGLKPIDWDSAHTGWYDIDEGGCSMGVCPTK